MMFLPVLIMCRFSRIFPWLIRKYSIQFYSSENVGKCKKNMKEVFSMSIHIGHRQRLKDRFRAEGLDHFSERHVLELLLFYAIPQRDTAPVAQALLDRFDTLPQVLEAPLEELEKVPGIGNNASTLLALITAIGRYYLVRRGTNHTVLGTTEQCGEYLLQHFHGRWNETVFLLCLDAKC
jgi:DNA repair protein RadC